MSKKLLVMTITGVLTLGLTAGVSMAFFASSKNSMGNTAAAATLYLVPSIGGTFSGNSPLFAVTPGGVGINGKVVFTRIAPGQNGTIEWVLYNGGSLPGILGLASAATFTDGPGAIQPESLCAGNNGGDNGDLDQYLMVTLQKGVGANKTSAEAALAYINGSAPWAISGLTAILNAQSSAMAAAGGSNYVVYLLTWSLSNTDANIDVVQGDTAQIDVTFSLNQ